MIAGGGPAGGRHPHHPEGAGEADFAGGGGDLLVPVSQLLLDQRHGVVRLSEALGSESLQEVLVGEILHQVDTHCVTSPGLHGPGHVDRVGRRGAQLGEGRDVDRSGRTAGVDARLVGGQRVGQRTELVVHLQRDRGGKVVVLLTGSLQQGEPDDDLSSVLRPAQLTPVARVGDLVTLAGGQVESEVLLLEPSAVGWLQTGRLQKGFLWRSGLLV